MRCHRTRVNTDSATDKELIDNRIWLFEVDLRFVATLWSYYDYTEPIPRYVSIPKGIEISLPFSFYRNVIAADMRSDDWLSVTILCHLQMLRGQLVMRCLSRGWDVLELSLGWGSAPLWAFPVMISPDTNTHFVLLVRVETETEAALSDWFVFTSGSALSDEELMAYTCAAVYLKHFRYTLSLPGRCVLARAYSRMSAHL